MSRHDSESAVSNTNKHRVMKIYEAEKKKKEDARKSTARDAEM